jgi:hypothetical protein
VTHRVTRCSLVLLVTLASAAAGACAQSLDTPENAVIRFGLSTQTGDSTAAFDRLCVELRSQILRGTPPANYRVFMAHDGIQGEGLVSEDDDQAVVRVSAFDPATEARRLWRIDLAKESGRWRLCGFVDLP